MRELADEVEVEAFEKVGRAVVIRLNIFAIGVYFVVVSRVATSVEVVLSRLVGVVCKLDVVLD